jgi:hypothetical protein
VIPSCSIPSIMNTHLFYAAFSGHHCLASGTLEFVARAVKQVIDRGEHAPILIFDSESKPVELDFRGSVDDVLKRVSKRHAVIKNTEEPPRTEKTGPGRPRLGVVAREITLLPRHWEWLGQQPGGASVALRRLVEEARRASQPQDRLRQARDAAYRFMLAVAGNLPGYEEALRALYAGDNTRFDVLIAGWPADIKRHVKTLMAAAGEDVATIAA